MVRKRESGLHTKWWTYIINATVTSGDPSGNAPMWRASHLQVKPARLAQTRNRSTHFRTWGILFGAPPQMAAWLYKDIVKWFPIRSLPDTRRSRGYQYENSRFSVAKYSAGMAQPDG